MHPRGIQSAALYLLASTRTKHCTGRMMTRNKVNLPNHYEEKKCVC
jgi:hypothetical protein